MEPQVNRDSLTMQPPEAGAEPVRVVEQTAPPREMITAPTRAVEHVESYASFAFHAVAAGLLAVAMLVWGGVAMARAGFDEPLRDPVVEVFGMSGSAVSGIIVASLGLLLLIAAVARDRGPIVFVAVVTGIAALVVAFEPGVGDDVLGVSSGMPTLLAIGCAVVLLITLAVPTINRTTRRVDRGV